MTLAVRLAALPPDERHALLATLDEGEAESLEYHWPLWARADQLAPQGSWRTWLLLGGRGSGKTRSAAEFIRSEVETGRRGRVAIIGPTSDSIRRDQLEGVSGILSISPNWNRPQHEPSTRRLVWPNGATAHLFSAEESDRLRGPNLDGFWWDELAASANSESVWANLQMALRLCGPKGHAPRGVISTTPRPQTLLRSILADVSTETTRSRTVDNRANLAADTLSYLKKRYAGTSLGRQELDAELLDSSEHALWTRQMFDSSRVSVAPPLRRILVGIDPAGSSGPASDETGIVVAGLADDGDCYVLADLSGRFSPERWASRALQAVDAYQADAIVVERNYGGDMVSSVIKSIDPRAKIITVTASRGKMLRAEPVAGLYEQGRVHHVGALDKLEDQCVTWELGRTPGSPDRIDALVWTVTELALTERPRPARLIAFDHMRR